MDAGGELNIDIRDADKDGIEGTDADRAASEAIMASINRDASTWQVVTRDEHTKVSGELDVQNLRNLQRNLDFVGRYAEVNNTSVPAHIAAEGAQAVDQFREIMLYGGASAAEAAEMMATPRFQVMLRERKSYDAIRDSDVSNDDLLKSIILIKSGEELYRDQNTGALMVRTVCGTEGPCGKT